MLVSKWIIWLTSHSRDTPFLPGRAPEDVRSG
jgi:hypothetical protein